MSVAPRVKSWTLEELHRLPDDGNKYELVRGELFVTPAPSNVHEMVIARLSMVLVPYVAEQKLGLVHHARSIIRHGGSEAEPDLFVRAVAADVRKDWEDAPTPLLVVEVLSDATRQRDLRQKRAFYMEDARVPEYWIVDIDARVIRVVRPGHADLVVGDTITWQPGGAGRPLTFRVTDLL